MATRYFINSDGKIRSEESSEPPAAELYVLYDNSVKKYSFIARSQPQNHLKEISVEERKKISELVKDIPSNEKIYKIVDITKTPPTKAPPKQKPSEIDKARDKEKASAGLIEDQVLLLLSLSKIINDIKKNKELKKDYKNFIRIKTDEPGNVKYFVNKLFNPKKINKFISATPLFLSSLLPKIRLYVVNQYKDVSPQGTGNKDSFIIANKAKIQNGKSYSALIPFEDGYRNLITIDNSTSILSNEYGKSHGIGIDSITINDGSSLEKPTNISVDVKLKLSNFDLLFKEFEIPSEEDENIKIKFQFKDLFQRNSNIVNTAGTVFEPVDDHNIRLKLVIGWSYDEKVLKRINYGSTDLKAEDIKDIRTALEKSSYTYNLGLKNTDITVEESGLIKLNVQYISSLETLFSSKTANVLYKTDESGKAINYIDELNNIKTLEQVKKRLEELQSSKKNIGNRKKEFENIEKEVKKKIEKIDKLLKTDYYGLHKQFITTLFKNSRIFSIKIPYDRIEDLSKRYYNTKKENNPTLVNSPKFETNEIKVQPICKKINDQEIEQTLKENKSINPSDIPIKNHRNIDFVFLGDILEYAFGCLNTDEQEYRNCIPIVGNFLFEEFNQLNIENPDVKLITKCVNYADIPISFERLKKFLFDEFINRQSQVINLEDFLKSIFNNIIYNAFTGNIFGEQFKLQFGTMATGQSNLKTIFEGNTEKEFFTRISYEDLLNRKFEIPEIDIKSFDNYSAITTNELSKKNHLVNYFYMFGKNYGVGGIKTVTMDDMDSYGIVNLSIGADKGILKKVNFSKSNKIDTIGIVLSEKRASAINNPLILQGLMNVDIEMFGNTFFKVGSMISIDPSFCLKSPNANKKSVAELGLGGFYTITKVNHELSSGKFITKAVAAFSHSYYNDISLKPSISQPSKELTYEQYKSELSKATEPVSSKLVDEEAKKSKK